jgi:hypothetical protein
MTQSRDEGSTQFELDPSDGRDKQTEHTEADSDDPTSRGFDFHAATLTLHRLGALIEKPGGPIENNDEAAGNVNEELHRFSDRFLQVAGGQGVMKCIIENR